MNKEYRRMPTEEFSSGTAFQLGQEVLDSDGNKIGKVQACFTRHLLVERRGLFSRAYYVPQTTIRKQSNGVLHLSLSEAELREHGYNSIPDDLYNEVAEPGVPEVFSGVPKVARSPLSPAQTGHYHYGRHWPGINTDATGSYHREEVLPIPQKLVQSAAENHRK
jgi:hypothetical protein